MSEYFKIIEDPDRNGDLLSVTVISGSAAGEKALINNGEICYLSDKEGFLSVNGKELFKLSGRGRESLAGEEVYTEKIGQSVKMVVCGCGHVSIPIIKLGKMLGFDVTAIDDRPEFAANAKAAGADEVITEAFDRALERTDSDGFTYFVIVTRGHHWDEECLKIIAKKPHAYIGMMGSKRRVDVVKENLKTEGMDEGVLDHLHAPIGLKIGSDTPEEIAVSVLAEIIEIKNKKKNVVMPKDILKAVNGSEHEEALGGRKILATIVSKEGSAPREAGTKMLITKDRAVNTIGGGLLESKIVGRAREILGSEEIKPELMRFELSHEAASTEGEVCGGTVYVFLEEVK